MNFAGPTTLPQLDGRWKLLYTSRPGSASPIQRTFVGVEAFKVFQEVDLTGQLPRVNNVVDFGWWLGYLKVRRYHHVTSHAPLKQKWEPQSGGRALHRLPHRRYSHQSNKPTRNLSHTSHTSSPLRTKSATHFALNLVLFVVLAVLLCRWRQRQALRRGHCQASHQGAQATSLDQQLAASRQPCKDSLHVQFFVHRHDNHLLSSFGSVAGCSAGQVE
jgi:hypothetical protein